MVKTPRRDDVYTPVQQAAFHKGYEDARAEAYASPGSEPEPSDTTSFSAEEVEAYRKGRAAGTPSFDGVAYDGFDG